MVFGELIGQGLSAFDPGSRASKRNFMAGAAVADGPFLNSAYFREYPRKRGLFFFPVLFFVTYNAVDEN